MRVDGIQSEEESRRSQASSQFAGGGMTNYQDWANVMSDLELAGVESTGSYEGDKALRDEIERNVDQFLAEAQQAQRAQEIQKTEGTQKATENDKEQEIKANLANATSSMIMADYMKYYHLMS
jgi:hypothetical protein